MPMYMNIYTKAFAILLVTSLILQIVVIVHPSLIIMPFAIQDPRRKVYYRPDGTSYQGYSYQGSYEKTTIVKTNTTEQTPSTYQAKTTEPSQTVTQQAESTISQTQSSTGITYQRKVTSTKSTAYSTRMWVENKDSLSATVYVYFNGQVVAQESQKLVIKDWSGLVAEIPSLQAPMYAIFYRGKRVNSIKVRIVVKYDNPIKVHIVNEFPTQRLEDVIVVTQAEIQVPSVNILVGNIKYTVSLGGQGVRFMSPKSSIVIDVPIDVNDLDDFLVRSKLSNGEYKMIFQVKMSGKLYTNELPTKPYWSLFHIGNLATTVFTPSVPIEFYDDMDALPGMEGQRKISITVNGFVKDPEDNPVGGASIDVLWLDKEYDNVAVTGNDGRFTVSLTYLSNIQGTLPSEITIRVRYMVPGRSTLTGTLEEYVTYSLTPNDFHLVSENPIKQYRTKSIITITTRSKPLTSSTTASNIYLDFSLSNFDSRALKAGYYKLKLDVYKDNELVFSNYYILSEQHTNISLPPLPVGQTYKAEAVVVWSPTNEKLGEASTSFTVPIQVLLHEKRVERLHVTLKRYEPQVYYKYVTVKLLSTDNKPLSNRWVYAETVASSYLWIPKTTPESVMTDSNGEAKFKMPVNTQVKISTRLGLKWHEKIITVADDTNYVVVRFTNYNVEAPVTVTFAVYVKHYQCQEAGKDYKLVSQTPAVGAVIELYKIDKTGSVSSTPSYTLHTGSDGKASAQIDSGNYKAIVSYQGKTINKLFTARMYGYIEFTYSFLNDKPLYYGTDKITTSPSQGTGTYNTDIVVKAPPNKNITVVSKDPSASVTIEGPTKPTDDPVKQTVTDTGPATVINIPAGDTATIETQPGTENIVKNDEPTTVETTPTTQDDVKTTQQNNEFTVKSPEQSDPVQQNNVVFETSEKAYIGGVGADTTIYTDGSASVKSVNLFLLVIMVIAGVALAISYIREKY